MPLFYFFYLNSYSNILQLILINFKYVIHKQKKNPSNYIKKSGKVGKW